MIKILAFILFIGICYSDEFECNTKSNIARIYGLVELRVNCKLDTNTKFVSEYKNGKRHGMAMSFSKSKSSPAHWIKYDSCFYSDGKKKGMCLVWDSAGNVVGKTEYKDGHPIGIQETYYDQKRLSTLTHYNDSGKEEGSWQEWWPNGNKKMVAQCHKGLIISDEEYFPNGVLRFKSKSSFEEDPSKGNQKTISLETFSPNGKPTGKVVNGNGEVWLFGEKPDSSSNRYSVSHALYKDGFHAGGDEADAATVEKLMAK